MKRKLLTLLTCIALLFSCRQEMDYQSNKNTAHEEYNFTKDNISTKILVKQDLQSKALVSQQVELLSKFLKNTDPFLPALNAKSLGSGNANNWDDDLEIYTDVF